MVAFIFAAVAAVASVVAARKAWQTVSLTQQIRNEARLERLAEALTDLIHACEHYPRPQTGEPPGRDDRFDAAQLRVIRAASLSMLGLSADISEPVLELLDPNAWKDPDRTMKYATAAYERLWDEADRLNLTGLKQRVMARPPLA